MNFMMSEFSNQPALLGLKIDDPIILNSMRDDCPIYVNVMCICEVAVFGERIPRQEKVQRSSSDRATAKPTAKEALVC